MKLKNFVYSLISTILLIAYCNASAGEYVRVSPDLELYYEEAGAGTPLIFIPAGAAPLSFSPNIKSRTFQKITGRYRTIPEAMGDPARHWKTIIIPSMVKI
jgi:hypothetical protein